MDYLPFLNMSCNDLESFVMIYGKRKFDKPIKSFKIKEKSTSPTDIIRFLKQEIARLERLGDQDEEIGELLKELQALNSMTRGTTGW